MSAAVQFTVHGTANQPVQGAPTLATWLQQDGGGGGVPSSASRHLNNALASHGMEAFVRALLAEAGATGGAEALRPLMQATAYQSGDYLTAHNDLHQTASGGRRLAIVAQFSSADWDATSCGGSLVWCDPVQVGAHACTVVTLSDRIRQSVSLTDGAVVCSARTYLA